ncbi:MAG: hypothetical protein LBH20_02845 [Treponema sp.]|jgi:uncharacterized protein YbjQ (UPF0145 family)|nr:hypothetical protein [Treponema sp.]
MSANKPKSHVFRFRLNGFLAIAAILALAACTTTDYSANTTGVSDFAALAVKDFVTLGIVTVQTTEIHYSSAFGLKKSIEGSKVTFADLMQEAAKLEADDIINVRIDTNANYVKGAFDWLSGWSRTYTHTGTALAIKYTEKLESRSSDSQVSGIPKAPEATSAVKTSRSGKTTLK